MVKLDSEVIPINVGGTHHMMTERDVLRLVPGSTLEKMFSGLHELKKIDDQVFLDLAHSLKPCILFSKDLELLKMASRAAKEDILITADYTAWT